MQCDHDLGQDHFKQGQAQNSNALNSNPNKCLWWIIQINVENKHCPKIMKTLLLNSKYSVDLDPPSWRF